MIQATRAVAAAFILLAAALPAACITAPQAVADATRLDEQAALSVELAYQASAIAMLRVLKDGKLDDDARARVRQLDRRAYAAVLAVRSAYDIGNATSYREAAIAARAAVRALLADVRR